MKRIPVILKYAILNAIPYAVGYGLGEFLGDLFAFPSWLTVVLACVLMLLAGFPGAKLLHWYEEHYSALDVRLFLCAVAFYAFFEFLTDYVFGRSLLGNLLDNLVYELGVGFMGYGFMRIILFFKIRRARRVFAQGTKGVIEVFPTSEAVPRKLSCRFNAPVGSSYDSRLAVKCTTGIFVGGRRRGVYFHKGIPYAQPPVGALRWKAPRPLPPSDGVYEAVHFSPVCPQPLSCVVDLNELPQSEDCLTLNIWRSEKCPAAKRPVMVLLHGGYLAFGGSAFSLNDGCSFVRQNPGTLFVSLNFRQGVWGVMDFSKVPGGEEYPDATELALLDQICALKWLRENIAAFGGDPENITLCGYDAGGSCAAVLATVPQARTLFRRMVLLSIFSDFCCTPERAQARTRELMEHLDVKTMAEMVRVPQERLRKAQDDLALYSAPFIAGRGMVPSDLLAAYRRGEARGIDVICCSTEDSTGCYLAELGVPRAREFFKRLSAELKERVSPEEYRLHEKYTEEAREQGCVLPENRFFDYLFFHSFQLALCRAQAAAGQGARYFRWRVGSSVKEFGAFCTIEVSHILGNLKVMEKYGIVGDPSSGRIVQRALANYMKDGDPDLPMDTVCHNRRLHWPRMTDGSTPVLVVEEDGLSIDGETIAARSLPVERILTENCGLAMALAEKGEAIYQELLVSNSQSSHNFED